MMGWRERKALRADKWWASVYLRQMMMYPRSVFGNSEDKTIP